MSVLLRALRTLAFHRRRTLAAGLVLALSLSLFAGMLQARAATQARVDALEADIATLVEVRRAGATGMGGGRDPLPASMGAWLARLPNVTKVEASLNQRLPSNQGEIVSIAVGIQPGNPMRMATMGNLQEPRVVQGRALEPGDANASVGVVGTAFAKTRGLALGDAFALENTTLRVVGIFEAGTRFGDNQLFLPLATAQRLFGHQGQASQFFVTAESVQAVPGLAERIDREASEDVDVLTAEETVDQARQTLGGAAANATLAAGLAGVVAVGTAAGFAAVLARQRGREVGVMKAIGASHGQVAGQLVAEVGLLGLGAGLLAAGLAALAGEALVGLLVTVPGGVGGSVGLGASAAAALVAGFTLSVIGGSIYPVMRAVTTPPAEAMRRGA